MTPFDLTGRCALVTGASRGIGREIALGFAAAGADLALAARTRPDLERLGAEVRDRGCGRCLELPTDVTDPAAISRMVQTTLAEFGGIDVLVNNAGGTSFMVPFVDLRFDGWEKVMRLNVDSIVHACQEVGRSMVARGQGSIINVASVAALQGTPTLAPYGASKAAVVSLTRTLALEWGHAGVRVNALCPGWTATDLNRNLWEDPAASEAMTASIPLGRWGQPGDMVGAALLLASDAGSYITGQTLVVDGGLTAR